MGFPSQPATKSQGGMQPATGDRACHEAEIEPDTREYTGYDPVSYVVSLNLRRRHLDESQRGMVAGRLETLNHGGNRKNQDANWHLDREAAARLLNVSPRSVARAKSVQRDGIPELGEKVDKGEIKVSVAADIARMPAAQQIHSIRNF